MTKGIVRCIVLTAVIAVSCGPGRHELLFERFHQLHQAVKQGEYETLVAALDEESSDYYLSVTDPERISLDKMIETGSEHGVLLFTIICYSRFGPYVNASYHKGPNATDYKTDFFKYLSVNELNWFYCPDHDSLIEDKCRIGKESYVAVNKKRYETDYLYWLKFIEGPQGAYRFDLLYTLDLEERRLRHYFEPLLNALEHDISTTAGALEFLRNYVSQEEFSLSMYEAARRRCENEQ